MNEEHVRVAIERVVRRLAIGKGVDDDEAKELTNAVADITRWYSTRELIPRRTAGLLYDLTLLLDNAAASYMNTPHESFVSALRFQVAELIRECFVAD